MRRSVARWLLDYDFESTRQCFALLPTGSGCDCNQCRNFDAAVERALPLAFRELTDALGVDPTKPAELCHYCREPSGVYLTGGWFHFVGQILSGEDVIHSTGGTGTFRFEELAPEFEFGFTTRLALVGEVFAGFRVVQLEFQIRLPWVLAEPEPADYS